MSQYARAMSKRGNQSDYDKLVVDVQRQAGVMKNLVVNPTNQHENNLSEERTAQFLDAAQGTFLGGNRRR